MLFKIKDSMQLSEQEIVRREKLKKLRELGINPYPANLFPVKNTSKSIKQKFKEGERVVVAGRLMSRRIQGSASFAELQDSEGRIQVYFNRDEICSGEDKSKYQESFVLDSQLSCRHDNTNSGTELHRDDPSDGTHDNRTVVRSYDGNTSHRTQEVDEGILTLLNACIWKQGG